MCSKFKYIFVTVGTTKFDKLVITVLQEDTINMLKELGCQKLVIQFGNGDYVPTLDDNDIIFEYYRYKDSILNDISQANLIISHAGAGTCIDVLRRRKPLITVVNDELMHNHQIELAEKLNEDGYSVFCYCRTLHQALNSVKTFDFKTLYYDYEKRCALHIEKLIHHKPK